MSDRMWHAGWIEVWGSGFTPPRWIRMNVAVSIRPEETVEEVAARWATENDYPVKDVRIHVWL